jgi:hypothetical protein
MGCVKTRNTVTIQSVIDTETCQNKYIDTTSTEGIVFTSEGNKKILPNFKDVRELDKLKKMDTKEIKNENNLIIQTSKFSKNNLKLINEYFQNEMKRSHKIGEDKVFYGSIQDLQNIQNLQNFKNVQNPPNFQNAQIISIRRKNSLKEIKEENSEINPSEQEQEQDSLQCPSEAQSINLHSLIIPNKPDSDCEINSINDSLILEPSKEKDFHKLLRTETDKSHKDDMRATLKGIYSLNKPTGNFTFANSNTMKMTMKTMGSNKRESNGNAKSLIQHIDSNNFTQNQLPVNENFENTFIKHLNGDISMDSIFTSRSLLSEKENLMNLIDEEEESSIDQGGVCTTITHLHTLDNSYSYQTIHTGRHMLNSSNINSLIGGNNFNTYAYNCSQSKLDDSFVSLNPNAQSKLVNFLPIAFDVFNKKNSSFLYKRIFLINLLKSLRQVAKFLNVKKSWEKEDTFGGNIINSQNYINNYDLLNNHTYELETIIPQESKDFLLPLYQLISNNLEIKISKLKKYKNDIINEKYQILDLISSEEVDSYWKMYHCRKIKDGNLFSVKIINKKKNKIISHEYMIENRMVYCNYALQIIEIITSNNFDYVIMDYVDCSIEEYIKNLQLDKQRSKDNLLEHAIAEENNLELIWKLLRNLISAVDYCHNVAKIAHRNLNLKNIFLIKKDYLLKISDYSISSYIVMDKEFLPNSTQMCCFPPPEYESENSYSGESGDIWACGVILFYMLFKYLPLKVNEIPHTLE